MEDEASTSLDCKVLGNLRVVDLKQELEKRGLSKSGSKKDLVKRLKQQLEFEKLCEERKSSGDLARKIELDADIQQNEFVQQYLAQQQKRYAEREEEKRLQMEAIQTEDERKSLGSSEDQVKSDQNTVSDSSEVCDVEKTENNKPSKSDESKELSEEWIGKDKNHSSSSENEDSEQNYPSKSAVEKDCVEQDNSVSQSHESDQNIAQTSINTVSCQEISQITSSSSVFSPKNKGEISQNSGRNSENNEKNYASNPSEIYDQQVSKSDNDLVQSPNEIKKSEIISDVLKDNPDIITDVSVSTADIPRDNSEVITNVSKDKNEVVLSANRSLDADDIELQSAVSSISRIEEIDTPPSEALPESPAPSPKHQLSEDMETADSSSVPYSLSDIQLPESPRRHLKVKEEICDEKSKTEHSSEVTDDQSLPSVKKAHPNGDATPDTLNSSQEEGLSESETKGSSYSNDSPEKSDRRKASKEYRQSDESSDVESDRNESPYKKKSSSNDHASKNIAADSEEDNQKQTIIKQKLSKSQKRSKESDDTDEDTYQKSAIQQQKSLKSQRQSKKSDKHNEDTDKKSVSKHQNLSKSHSQLEKSDESDEDTYKKNAIKSQKSSKSQRQLEKCEKSDGDTHKKNVRKQQKPSKSQLRSDESGESDKDIYKKIASQQKHSKFQKQSEKSDKSVEDTHKKSVSKQQKSSKSQSQSDESNESDEDPYEKSASKQLKSLKFQRQSEKSDKSDGDTHKKSFSKPQKSKYKSQSDESNESDEDTYKKSASKQQKSLKSHRQSEKSDKSDEDMHKKSVNKQQKLSKSQSRSNESNESDEDTYKKSASKQQKSMRSQRHSEKRDESDEDTRKQSVSKQQKPTKSLLQSKKSDDTDEDTHRQSVSKQQKPAKSLLQSKKNDDTDEDTHRQSVSKQQKPVKSLLQSKKSDDTDEDSSKQRQSEKCDKSDEDTHKKSVVSKQQKSSKSESQSNESDNSDEDTYEKSASKQQKSSKSQRHSEKMDESDEDTRKQSVSKQQKPPKSQLQSKERDDTDEDTPKQSCSKQLRQSDESDNDKSSDSEKYSNRHIDSKTRSPHDKHKKRKRRSLSRSSSTSHSSDNSPKRMSKISAPAEKKKVVENDKSDQLSGKNLEAKSEELHKDNGVSESSDRNIHSVLPKKRLKIKRDNVPVDVPLACPESSGNSASGKSVEKNYSNASSAPDKSPKKEMPEVKETIPEVKKAPRKEIIPEVKYATRKITLLNRRLNRNTSEDKSNEPKSKRNKWESFASSKKASNTISISTDSLKNWFPDFKLISEPPSMEIETDEHSLSAMEERTIPDHGAVLNENHTGLRRDSTSLMEVEDSKSQEPSLGENPVEDGPVSKIIFVQNLVRPFTLNQLKDLLKQSGKIVEEYFWIDKIKSKCFVMYETEKEAIKARNALNKTRWPLSNPKILKVDFTNAEEMEQHKKGNEVPPPKPVVEQSVVEPSAETIETRITHPIDDHKRREKERERRRDRERSRPQAPIREWDKDKVMQDSPERERFPKEEKPWSSEKEKRKESKKRPNEDTPAKLLDDLFQKTKNPPCIYWLPLTEELAKAREEAKKLRKIEKEKRSQQLREQDADRRTRRERPSQDRSSRRSREKENRKSSTRSRSPISRRR